MRTATIIFQTLLAVALAPLLSGFIRKIKNFLRMRKGPSIFQPYYNFLKYISKGEVISEHTSIIFRVTPYIVLSAMITALFIVPVFHSPLSAKGMGGVLAIFFILALARFFQALAALDAASPFGGIGASREMFLSAIAEPVAISAVAAIAWRSGALDMQAIQTSPGVSFSVIIGATALFMITLAETSRVPVDNQETHLELTMVHEALLLEYSGRSLALSELAAHIKQFIFFSLLACILGPVSVGPDASWRAIASAVLFFAGEMVIIAFSVALVEISVAKMRLFRVVDFLGYGLVLSILALVALIAGY